MASTMTSREIGQLIAILGLFPVMIGILVLFVACGGVCNCPGGTTSCSCLCSEPAYSFGLVLAALGVGTVVSGIVLGWRARAR